MKKIKFLVKKTPQAPKMVWAPPKTKTFCVFLVKEKIVLVFEAIQANLRAPEFFFTANFKEITVID